MNSAQKTLDPFRNIVASRHQIAKSWKSQGRHVIGWNCSYTPEELIYAANALPIIVFGEAEPSTLADVHLPVNCCSFVRSSFNSALKGDYAYLDGFVATNSCDNRNKAFDMWKTHVEIPFLHFINTPRTRTESAHDFFFEEIRRFRTSLEKNLGTPISDDALKRAVRVYNENRRKLKQVYEYRKKDPPLISGVEALDIVLSSMLTAKEAHNTLLSSLLPEIPNRSDPQTDGVRLLACGSIMDNTELIKIAEASGGSVVADDWCTGSRYFWNLVDDGGDPLKAISRRYLNKIPSSFMFSQRERFAHAITVAKEFDVEAAIIFDLKFCDTHLFDAPQLIEELKGLGLPVLHLEWEHSLSGVAQLKTRIEAFMEMVAGVE